MISSKKSLDLGGNGVESLGRVHLLVVVHLLGLVAHICLVDLDELGKSEDQRVVVPQPAGGHGSPALPALGISIPLVGARVPPGHHPAAPNCDVQVIIFEVLLSSQAHKRGFFSMVKSLDSSALGF